MFKASRFKIDVLDVRITLLESILCKLFIFNHRVKNIINRMKKFEYMGKFAFINETNICQNLNIYFIWKINLSMFNFITICRNPCVYLAVVNETLSKFILINL